MASMNSRDVLIEASRASPKKSPVRHGQGQCSLIEILYSTQAFGEERGAGNERGSQATPALRCLLPCVE